MPARRRRPEAPEEGAPAWMVTFSDMMTLLLCFFVLLFSMSVVQEVKFKAAMGSLRHWLGFLPLHTDVLPGRRQPAAAARRAEEALRRGVAGEHVEVMTVEEGKKIVLGGRVLFAAGSSRLLPEGRTVLRELADPLRAVEFRIEVRGHASPGEAAEGVYEDEWELGWARARAVARFLVEGCGIRADRLRIASGGSVDPAAPNLFPEEASRDRRVEIVVTGELLR